MTNPVPRILIVEDDRDGADTMAMMLDLLGYEVHVARDGPEGIAAAEAFGPDVVLCDIGLPGYDGYEVARRLRARGAGKLLMVAVTGRGQVSDRERAMAAGFDHYLIKPVSPSALAVILQSAGHYPTS